MNTKIIVALVVGIVLVGLSGTASAAYYYIDGNYVYGDSASDEFDAYTEFEVELEGNNPAGEDMFMHNWVDNWMVVDSVSSAASNVNFGFVQGGASTLTIETDLPGSLNTFVADDSVFQNLGYETDGDAFEIYFFGDSITHASTHEGILPIEELSLWDYHALEATSEASGYWNNNNIWVPTASIKAGSIGYEANSHGEAVMEAEHVLGPVTASTSIMAWSSAEGEIWHPMGQISSDVDASTEVFMWWPTP